MKEAKAPANAFEWRRFVVEEDVRRNATESLARQSNISRTRSVASTQAIERIRETLPTYGTVGLSKKTQAMIDLKPRQFTI